MSAIVRDLNSEKTQVFLECNLPDWKIKFHSKADEALLQ